ncbi:MAG TPA: EAL domain-containing protein [Thermoanaerobaculia bacterium]|nr:EAL domain-containing protein [Thermoanaerobaculia bacterium]
MTSETELMRVSLVFLAVASVLTYSILFFLRRHYRRGYLQRWERSWLWLAVFHLGAPISLQLNLSGESTPLLVRILASTIVNGGSCLHVVYLLSGAWELRKGRVVADRWLRIWSLSAAGLALVLVLLFSWDHALVQERILVRSGGRGLLYGLAFIPAGVMIWRALAGRGGIGYRLLGGSIVAYGIYGFQVLGLTAISYLDQELRPLQLYLGFIEILPQMGIAAGMVIVLLEEERHSAIQAAQQIEHLAYHDPLTGLPNRSLFLDRLRSVLASAPRHGREVAVAFLDLDLFKRINDSLGHAVGDEMMRGVAHRLRGALRAGDTVARMGGDEFTLLLEVHERADAERVLSRVLDALRHPFSIQGRELIVTASAGVAITAGEPVAAESLVRHADLALYRAKQEGKDVLRFFEGGVEDDHTVRLALELALRRALEVGDQLLLYYQPLFAAGSGAVVGVEALLRWRQPSGRLRLPTEFVPLAEASGLIVPLGRWVIEEACRQAAGWRQAGAVDLTVAVNLSARQLNAAEFVQQLARSLADCDLPGSALQVEITESVAMQDVSLVGSVLSRLRELGVSVTLDDFGTGYSSLAHLQSLPIDGLKIDASFVKTVHSDPGSEAIVRAILSLGKELQLEVTAEGVETEQQLAILSRLGCPQLQGFYLGHPLPPGELETFLTARGVLGAA